MESTTDMPQQWIKADQQQTCHAYCNNQQTCGNHQKTCRNKLAVDQNDVSRFAEIWRMNFSMKGLSARQRVQKFGFVNRQFFKGKYLKIFRQQGPDYTITLWQVMKFAGLSRSPCFSLPRGIWSLETKKLVGPTSRAESINLLICAFRTREIIPNSHHKVAINRHFSWNKRALSVGQPLVTHCTVESDTASMSRSWDIATNVRWSAEIIRSRLGQATISNLKGGIWENNCMKALT
jgi:hypothetical protein